MVVDPGFNPEEDEFTLRGEHSVSPRFCILGEHVRGGFAEYAVVPAASLAALPDSVDFPEAAAPLVVTITAWRMLIHRANLRAGQSVLIVGAGGRVQHHGHSDCEACGGDGLRGGERPGEARPEPRSWERTMSSTDPAWTGARRCRDSPGDEAWMW